MNHGHELVESADACAFPDGLRACAAESVGGMTAISSAASSANADEHDPAAQTLTGHSADAEFEMPPSKHPDVQTVAGHGHEVVQSADAGFECGVATLSCDVARWGMEGYVRPSARDCCAAVLSVCA